jgi:predicted nucleotide-binding protein
VRIRKTSHEVKIQLKINKKVFIVHGKDLKPVKELKIILQELGLTPIVLMEQPSKGLTIVEKLERYSNVGYAFVILTPDDVGASKIALSHKAIKEPKNKSEQDCADIELPIIAEYFRQRLNLLKNEARQNVILEFGYFTGKLGRKRVCCLYKGDIQLPSDMEGICYAHFSSSVMELKKRIVKELVAAGYKIRQD